VRLFLDANILFLTGYSSKSPVHLLLELSQAGLCELVVSGYAVEEARRNLATKGPATGLDALDAALHGMLPVAEARGAALEAAEAVGLSDAADVPILAAAIQCKADILVTGDRRAFGRLFRTRVLGVEVLTLRDALRRVVGVPLE
jgi:predicted nucleic acid-binding protein